MAREPARRAGAEASSASARTQKRARESFLDGKQIAAMKSTAGEVVPVIPTQGLQHLQEQMKEELDAIRALHRRAVLLCRGAGGSGATKGDARFPAAGPRREKPTEVAAKRRKTSSLESVTEPKHHKEAVKQQQRPVQRAAPRSANEEDDDARKRRWMEEKEIACAREECRQQVLEAERAALPDEMVYSQDLEELGIAPFEYVVMRTEKWQDLFAGQND